MTRRNRKQDPAVGQEPNPADDPWGGRKSRSQKKREAHGLLALGLRLVEHKAAGLKTVPLDDALRAAVQEGQRLTKNARSRQLRLIAKMLRERDVQPIEGALDTSTEGHRKQVAAEQVNDRWRQRLMAEGDTALAAFVDEYPGRYSGQMRTLIRQARVEGEGARVVRARRELLRMVRAIRVQAAADPAHDRPVDSAEQQVPDQAQVPDAD